MKSSGQSSGPQGKTRTSTTVHTDTHTITENGTTETTVIKITTDHFSDGTTTTRKEVQDLREEEIVVGEISTQRQPGTSNHIAPMAPTPSGHHPSHSTDSGANTRISMGYTIDPSSPRADLKTDDTFIEEALQTHNLYRHKHNAPPLTVSRELCRIAQSWANQLSYRGTMENSHYGYGENIYWTSGPGNNMRGDVPVEYWYHEGARFDWGKMDFQKSTGSFTQLIWKDSKQVGIAKAGGAKGTYIVAFYSPPGNVLGQFLDNVLHAAF